MLMCIISINIIRQQYIFINLSLREKQFRIYNVSYRECIFVRGHKVLGEDVFSVSPVPKLAVAEHSSRYLAGGSPPRAGARWIDASKATAGPHRFCINSLSTPSRATPTRPHHWGEEGCHLHITRPFSIGLPLAVLSALHWPRR